MKRYDIDVQPDRSYYGQGERFEAFAYESGQGDWVRQEDVEALQALNAEMLEALEDAIEVLAGIGNDDAHAYSVALTVHAAIARAKGERS